MSKFILVITVFSALICLAKAESLTAVEKDKILFMIFENQNKKISHEFNKSCKKAPKEDWECSNQQAKNYLMNLYRTKSAHAFNLKTDIECEAITPKLQKNIETQQQAYYGPLEFRREVKQSLKGQWLCRFHAQQHLPSGLEDFDDKSVFKPNTDGTTNLHTGLSFIMNRDKTRIVSRKFAAWTSPTQETKN